MILLMILFCITALTIGATFCILLIGGLPFRKGKEFAPIRIGLRVYSVERFAVGMSTSIFGFSWLIAWFYFLTTGWESSNAQLGTIALQAALQLAASVGLIVAGIGIFKKWKYRKGIFLLSMLAMIVSVGTAIFLLGPSGREEHNLMYLFGIWTFVVGGFFTIVIYFIDRFKNSFTMQQ